MSPNPRNCPKCGGQLEPYAGICPQCHALTPVLAGQAGAAAPSAAAGSTPPPASTQPAAGPPNAAQRAAQAAQYGRPAQPAGAAPADRRSLAVGALAGGITVLIVICVILFVVHGMQRVTTTHSAVRGGDSKQGLHDIQVALEKYRQDNGQYPPYLIGGEARYASVVVAGQEMPFKDIRDCERSGVSDPLLRGGYLTAYPADPFITKPGPLHAVQCNVPSAMQGEDPLRNDSADGERLGTRFGAQCQTMGSVLADPRYRNWMAKNSAPGFGEIQLPTGADVEYAFWDMWANAQPLPYLPGEFFYKSAGPLAPPAGFGEMGGPPVPLSTDYYMLGAYGGIKDKGQDVLGDEPTLSVKLSGGSGELKVHPWTRSSCGSMDRAGSPYGAADSAASPCYPFKYGNPNGNADGVILVLTAK
jgi:hypothetical protein